MHGSAASLRVSPVHPKCWKYTIFMISLFLEGYKIEAVMHTASGWSLCEIILEQEQPIFSILNHPSQSLLQPLSSNGTTRDDGPSMRLDAAKIQPLLLSVTDLCCSTFNALTLMICSSFIAPAMSVLFLKINKLAPISRCD